jgi:hypothetical protein
MGNGAAAASRVPNAAAIAAAAPLCRTCGRRITMQELPLGLLVLVGGSAALVGYITINRT